MDAWIKSQLIQGELNWDIESEQFSILKEGTQEYEIQDSGKAQPVIYEDVDDPRS